MKAEEKSTDYSVLKVPETMASGWHRVRLGDIAKVVRGVTYKKEQASGQPATDMLPILRATNVQDGTLVLDSNLVFVPVELVSDTQKLRVGDIVVATSSGSKHLVGKTAQVREAWEGSFGAFCAVIRPTSDIDQRYLGYFFETREYKDYISKKALGVNINNLRRGDLEEISVPVAPLDQQKRIVAEIEKQFSRLDEAVANLKRVKVNLKRYKAAVLKAAVEGKLTEAWRKQHPDTEPASELLQRILTERRAKWEQAELAKMQAKGKTPKNDAWKKKYSEPVAPDTTGLPELPKGWMWVSLDNLIVDGPQNGLYLPKLLYGSGHPILRIDDYQQDWIRPVSELQLVRAKPEDIATYSLRYGDIVINRVNSPSHLGKVAIWVTKTASPLFESNMMRASLSSAIDPLYVAMYLRSLHGRARLTKQAKWAVNQASINQQDVCATQVPLPPLAEQHCIAAEVERCLSLADEAETQVNSNLQRADHLRQSILKRAFSGTILVRERCHTPHVSEGVINVPA